MKNFDLELKCYVSYFSGRYLLNEISYSTSAKSKHKIKKFWFGTKVLCVLFLRAVSSQWNFILIWAKNKHKIEKFWFGIEVLCVILFQQVSSQWNFILISAKNKHKIEKILIWNRSVMCHISQGGIFWMKFHTQFQLTIRKNSWNYDFEFKSYTSYVSRGYSLNEIWY